MPFSEVHNKRIQANGFTVLQVAQHSRDVHRVQELNVNKREIHLIEVNYCDYTWPENQLEASRKQHEILCKRFKEL